MLTMPAALKRVLRTALVRTGAVEIGIRLAPVRVPIVMYHGISPRAMPPSLFEDQLRYVRSHFDTYWVSEIPAVLARLGDLARPALVLTFDDGSRSQYRIAAPLLERYGIKANFYLVSGLLDGTTMLWNHELCCRLALLRDDAMPDGVPSLPADPEARWRRAKEIAEAAKAWGEDQRQALLQRLRARVPQPDYPAWMREDYELMSAAEARSLPAVVEIGSHSRTHSLLDRISLARAEREIRESKAELETATGRPVRTFCYPNGAFAREHVGIVRRTYDAAVSTARGFAHPGDSPFELKRIPAARTWESFVLGFLRAPS